MGKAGAISLVDGEIISLADLRGRMAPWALLHAGPRGAIKTRSPVDDWMSCPGPPVGPARGNAPRPAAADLRRRRLCQSSTATGRRRTRRKAAISSRSRPISPVSFPTTRSGPGCGTGSRTRRAGRGYPMVAVIMVAEKFGSGRGTLFDILDLVFGNDSCRAVRVRRTDGKSAGGAVQRPARRRPVRLSSTRRSTKTGDQQNQRRTTYDALKNAIEPSPTARRRFERRTSTPTPSDRR